MKKILCFTMFISLIFANACKNDSMNNTDMKPPVAEKIPKELEIHGDIRIDNYFWMRLSDAQKKQQKKMSKPKKFLTI